MDNSGFFNVGNPCTRLLFPRYFDEQDDATAQEYLLNAREAILVTAAHSLCTEKKKHCQQLHGKRLSDLRSRDFAIRACKAGNLGLIQAMYQSSVPLREVYAEGHFSLCYYAAQGGHTPLLRWLIAIGAPAATSSTELGRTPFHAACENCHISSARVFMETLDRRELSLGDKMGITALQLACAGKDRRAVARLVICLFHSGLRPSPDVTQEPDTLSEEEAKSAWSTPNGVTAPNLDRSIFQLSLPFLSLDDRLSARLVSRIWNSHVVAVLTKGYLDATPRPNQKL